MLHGTRLLERIVKRVTSQCVLFTYLSNDLCKTRHKATRWIQMIFSLWDFYFGNWNLNELAIEKNLNTHGHHWTLWWLWIMSFISGFLIVCFLFSAIYKILTLIIANDWKRPNTFRHDVVRTKYATTIYPNRITEIVWLRIDRNIVVINPFPSQAILFYCHQIILLLLRESKQTKMKHTLTNWNKNQDNCLCINCHRLALADTCTQRQRARARARDGGSATWRFHIICS